MIIKLTSFLNLSIDNGHYFNEWQESSVILFYFSFLKSLWTDVISTNTPFIFKLEMIF